MAIELRVIGPTDDHQAKPVNTGAALDGYFSGYGPKPLAEQVDVLRQRFARLDSVNLRLAETALPDGAEGWFAIPQWQKVGSVYGEALHRVLEAIRMTRMNALSDFIGRGQLGRGYIRQHQHTVGKLGYIARAQRDADILVVPAQFGMLRTEHNVRETRSLNFGDYEFGLGAFQVACMLMTHPERLQACLDLGIECPGDEYDHSGGARKFSMVTCFEFRDDEGEARLRGKEVGRRKGIAKGVEFLADRITDNRPNSGSASGFIPGL